MVGITYDLVFDKIGIDDKQHQELIKNVFTPVMDIIIDKVIPKMPAPSLKHGPVVEAS